MTVMTEETIMISGFIFNAEHVHYFSQYVDEINNFYLTCDSFSQSISCTIVFFFDVTLHYLNRQQWKLSYPINEQ